MATFKRERNKQLLEYQNVNPNPVIDEKQLAKAKKKQIIIVICATILTVLSVAGMIVTIVFCL